MDNDLLTLWLGALFLSEPEIRALIEQLQAERDNSAALQAVIDAIHIEQKATDE